ncbi:MAG: hypothetical protein QFX33_03505 [Candidatus Nezhaarchaeota archaeon]|nr:hypothetical protein [Candidatus Nezhaarchaeota archaeon]
MKATRLILVQARGGNPSKMDFYATEAEGTAYLGSLLLSGVKLTREHEKTVRAPVEAMITIAYKGWASQKARVARFLPTLFDVECCEESCDECRWIMNVEVRKDDVEITFIDRSANLPFGPTLSVKDVVLPST